MNTTEFSQQVLERSYEIPVLVDFWAPWCGPCRTLGPTLEQLAEEQSDRWVLVKVNTEEAQELARQFRIMSIPNVKLFRNGEVIGEFQGALPRVQIERFLDEYIPDEKLVELEKLVAKATEVPDEDLRQQLATFVEKYPDVPEANLALARHAVFTEPERAKELVANIQLGHEQYDQAEDIRTIADLLTLDFVEVTPVADVLAKAKKSLQNQELEAAIQQLIEAATIDKNYFEDLPRRATIALFRTLGKQHPLTKQYRRRFDMVLY